MQWRNLFFAGCLLFAGGGAMAQQSLPETEPQAPADDNPTGKNMPTGPWKQAPTLVPGTPGVSPVAPPATPPTTTPGTPGARPAKPGPAPGGGGGDQPGLFSIRSLKQFSKALSALFTRAKEPGAEEFNQAYDEIWEMVGVNYHLPERLAEWEKWKKPHTEIKDRESFNKAIEAMLSSLKDEWTRYIPPQAMEQAKQDQKNELFSIGVEVVSDAYGDFTVHYVTYGSPAYKTGKVRKDDRLVAVNGVRVLGKSRHEVEAMLKAKKANTVSLVIEHAGRQEGVMITSVETEQSLVTMRLLPPDNKVMYLRLPDFVQPMNIEMLIQAASLGLKQSNYEAEWLALDLRGNPGGLFPLAIELSDLLMDEGEICTMTSRTMEVMDGTKYTVIPEPPHLKLTRDEDEVRVRRWLKTCRLYVLVDGSSASCSEVVTGALKDNGRAIVIGVEPTFGKGVAYQKHTVPYGIGGMLMITTGHYLTPGKRREANKERPFDVGYLENPHNLAIEGGITPNLLVEDQRATNDVDAVLAAVVAEVNKGRFDPMHGAMAAKPARAGYFNQRTTAIACGTALGGAFGGALIVLRLARRRKRTAPVRRIAA